MNICQNEDCEDANCPGSDDEKHHCDECQELENVEDGKFCAMCNNYYCFTHWDDTFITLDCQNNEFDPNDLLFQVEMDDMICWNCYEEHEKFHCLIPRCMCDQGFDKNYRNHQQRM
jgi:hypothetical protein